MSEDPKFIPKGEEIGPNPKGEEIGPNPNLIQPKDKKLYLNLIQSKDKKLYTKFVPKNIKVARIK